ncbi:MAG: FMN-binding protein [Spirochaetales bacterium]|nr:FMN-binding protein [Spirochaetales bacterium]MBP7264351.1 FMN-binding protein [Spirochaetia bacterium]
MKKDSLVYTVVFTFVVALAFVFVLALANDLTAARVADNKAFATQSAVLKALGVDYADPDEARRLFAELTLDAGDATGPAWKATIDGQSLVVVQETGAGLWGAITIMLAARPDAGRVSGVAILAQNETPGLGGRIEEAAFLDQFRGERSDGGIDVAVGAELSGLGDPDPDNGRVDGVTGASRTSVAFGTIVNAALARVRAISGGL